MNISFIKKREKILFIIVGALAIIGVTGYYIYFYAPLGEIKNLNRAVIRQCNRLLNDKTKYYVYLMKILNNYMSYQSK